MSSTHTVVPSPCHESVGRDALVDAHVGLVYSLAVKAYHATCRTVELDDLVSFGTEGLLQAADRFDPEAGATFGTYAYYRIRGAIYDGLRQMAPVPRSAYRKLQETRRGGNAEATVALVDKRGRTSAAFVISLEFYKETGGADESTQVSVEEQVSRSEVRRMLKGAVARLPEREQQIIESHYYGGTTIREAGDELGVSKSWASRLHARAIDMLREQLAATPELACV